MDYLASYKKAAAKEITQKMLRYSIVPFIGEEASKSNMETWITTSIDYKEEDRDGSVLTMCELLAALQCLDDLYVEVCKHKKLLNV